MMTIKPQYIILGAITCCSLFLAGITPASANWWAGGERSGSCFVPNNQTSFRCHYGSYKITKRARQIGGFYVNPTNNVNYTGNVSIQYRTKGRFRWGNWQGRDLKMNATQGNYIDFGNGVQEFEFRFVRTPQNKLYGDMTIDFKMNYDLDQ